MTQEEYEKELIRLYGLAVDQKDIARAFEILAQGHKTGIKKMKDKAQ